MAEPRTWSMPRIPLDVTLVERIRPLPEQRADRYQRDGDTRWWRFIDPDGRLGSQQITEKDLIAGYGPLREVQQDG